MPPGVSQLTPSSRPHNLSPPRPNHPAPVYHRVSMQSLARKLFLPLLLLSAATAIAQDNVFTGTNTGADRIRIAVSNFKPGSGDPETPQLKATFDATLYSDLAAAGIFDIVSKEASIRGQTAGGGGAAFGGACARVRLRSSAGVRGVHSEASGWRVGRGGTDRTQGGGGGGGGGGAGGQGLL